MTSPVVIPKPKRLLSPKTVFDSFEEKKQDGSDASDKMFFFESRFERPEPPERSGGSHEACLEVERILLALEDVETDQKSPILEDPRDTFVQDPQYSPPLRAVSPPARSQNPQAEAIEAMWRESEVVDSEECLPQAGQHVYDDDENENENESEMFAIEQFQRRPTQYRSQFQSLTEPSSPYSAPHYMAASLGCSRRNSIPGDEEDDQDREDIDIVFIEPRSTDMMIMEDYDYERSDSVIPEDYQGEENGDDIPQEPESCPITVQVTGPPMSMRRYQSLPGSGSSSTKNSNKTKRKRGKPKYESRSLPIAVGCDLILTLQRRQIRTMSDTVRQSCQF